MEEDKAEIAEKVSRGNCPSIIAAEGIATEATGGGVGEYRCVCFGGFVEA